MSWARADRALRILHPTARFLPSPGRTSATNEGAQPEPTSGSARVLGFDPAHDPLEIKRHVGYLPENVGFYDDLTGEENLRYMARLNQLPDGKARRFIPVVPARAEGAVLPESVDNSAGLPPVGDQGNQSSCVAFTFGYYCMTYAEAKEHGWSPADPAHQFSPAYIYN